MHWPGRTVEGTRRPERPSRMQGTPRGVDRDLLAAVVESSQDAIVTKDLRGVVTSWNAGAQRIFGYTAEEMVGQPITRIFPPDRLGEEESILARIAAGERVDHFETKRVRKDGAVIDVSETVSPLRDARGRLVGASKIARDVTERRRAERERALLAAIVASSSDAIVATDLDGRITIWNAGAERLYGYTAEEIVGRPMDALFPPERLHEAGEALAAARSGVSVEREETQRRRKDGTLVDVAVTVSPLRDPDGTIFGITGIAQDVTEHHRREAAERAAAQAEIKALREVEEFRARFINSAAHELSNPLTPMAVQLRLMAQRATDPATARAVAIVQRNFQRMARGVRDLLDAARIEASRLRLETGPVRLRALVRDAAESYAPAAQEEGVRLVATEGPDVVVEGDEGRLMQVLYNLLSNALKFTPRGGEVHVGAARHGARVRLWVRDTGAGMSPAQLKSLFHPYRQVHDPREGRRGGMGLGLYISRALAEAHGGRLWAESEGPGEGTTMWVELPMQRPAVA